MGYDYCSSSVYLKEERARLQTVPTKYVKCMTEKDAADLLGDGWTVDVIAWILSFLPKI